MSLATRCTACGTVFRVVQDQLKVSEGWVRCGRCQEVFNALEGLFDLDREGFVPPSAAAAGAAGSAATAGTASAAASASTASRAAAAPTSSPGAFDDEASESAPAPLEAAAAGAAISIARFTSQPAEQRAGAQPESKPASTPAADAAEPPSSSTFDPSTQAPTSTAADEPDASGPPSQAPDSQDFADARFNSKLFESDSELGAAPADDLKAGGAADPAAAAAAASSPSPAVDELSFLQQAEREALWQQPGVRRSMMMITGVLAVSLVVQIAVYFHDGIAARWPGVRGTMELLCTMADCEIEPPRRLEALSVDSSGLQRIGETDGDGYRLSVSLRNSADHVVLPPSVELSLTDANGQLISRRVLAPADFAYVPPGLPPRGETTLQTVLLTGGERVSGYTVEIFYP